MVKLFRKNFLTYVITIHQRYKRTDRQTTCDRKTALCTKVHRAVKIEEWPTSKGDQGMRGADPGAPGVCPFPFSK